MDHNSFTNITFLRCLHRKHTYPKLGCRQDRQCDLQGLVQKNNARLQVQKWLRIQDGDCGALTQGRSPSEPGDLYNCPGHLPMKPALGARKTFWKLWKKSNSSFQRYKSHLAFLSRSLYPVLGKTTSILENRAWGYKREPTNNWWTYMDPSLLPKSVVYTRIHSWCGACYWFGQIYPTL